MRHKITKELKLLIENLKPQIKYLSSKYRISGMVKNDLQQELVLKIILDYQKEKNRKTNKGWWFKRLQWHLYNMIKRAQLDPLNKTISVNTFDL